MTRKTYDLNQLLFTFFLCLASCCGGKETYTNPESDSLQSDIQEYLRSITHQNPLYREQNYPPVLPGAKLQQSAWRLPIPEEGRLGNPYGKQEFPSVDEESEGLIQPWPGVPFQANTPGVREHTYASSSASTKTFSSRMGGLPDMSSDSVNARAVAYSSVRDVDAEESLGEHQALSQASVGSTINEPSKKSPQPVQQTASVSEAFARKSEPSTAFQKQITETTKEESSSFGDIYFVAVVAGCSAIAIFGIVSAGYCFHRLQKSSKAAAEVDYPAYGVTGPSKDAPSPNGDRKLAQSAQMYHYQHQKQQMIAVEKAGSTKNTSASDVDSEEENEEGDYTVYECPGLAPTGEMEVKNPLFNDDSTPMSPPVVPSKPDGFQGK